MQNSPVLITGSEGCGKSQAVSAYSEIFCSSLTKVCLTPDSEPSLLVGQLIPNDQLNSKSERIVWQDGVITESIKNSSWVLLDNLNQAESAVLERLNPVLDDPPIWNISQIKDLTSTEKLKLEEEIAILLNINIQPEIIRFLPQSNKVGEHVFAGSRLQIAEAVMAAVECQHPILLECPVAVG